MDDSNERPMDRRRFIGSLTAALSTALIMPLRVAGDGDGSRGAMAFAHPDPRPEVDGSRVLTSSEVREEVADLFDGIRAIPEIADGIGCHCGCGAMPEMRSLLSCYEGVGMAQYCAICSGEGRMAIDLHAEGRTLDEIRSAIDRRFG